MKEPESQEASSDDAGRAARERRDARSRIATATLLTLSLVIAAIVGFELAGGHRNLIAPAGRAVVAPIARAVVAPVARAVVAPVARAVVPRPQHVFSKDRIALLVLGIDYDYTGKDLPTSRNARSDTIMAVSLDFPSGTARVLSVPRDMLAKFPDGSHGKINAAFAEGGVHEAERVVATFLGLPSGFDRYVVLRVEAAKDLVNAVGGIDVTPDETMDYDDAWGHLHIHFRRGVRYHLNGEQAVSYSRFRHDSCGDPCRIRRQQQVMRLLVAKLAGGRLNDVGRVGALVRVLRRDVDTDVTTSEAISLAVRYAGTDPRAFKTEQLPFVDDPVLPGVGSVLLPDEHAKQRMVRRLFLAPAPAPRASAGTGGTERKQSGMMAR